MLFCLRQPLAERVDKEFKVTEQKETPCNRIEAAGNRNKGKTGRLILAQGKLPWE